MLGRFVDVGCRVCEFRVYRFYGFHHQGVGSAHDFAAAVASGASRPDAGRIGSDLIPNNMCPRIGTPKRHEA